MEKIECFSEMNYINDYNLTKSVETVNNMIYNYFAETYGTIKDKTEDKKLMLSIKVLVNIN